MSHPAKARQSTAKAAIVAIVAFSACGAAADAAAPQEHRNKTRSSESAPSEQGDFISKFSGNPYMGRIGVGIRPPRDSGLAASRDSGRGSLQFVPAEGDSVRLILSGNIRAPGDAGFAVEGQYVDSGWRSKTGEVSIEIAPDGTVTGGGISHPYRFRFGGKISEFQALVETDLELLEASQGGFPVGTRFNFYYVLQRPKPDPTPGDDGDCREIAYRLQSFANPFGGTLGMVRVPYCVR